MSPGLSDGHGHGGGALGADCSCLNFAPWVPLPPFLLPPGLRGQESGGVGGCVYVWSRGKCEDFSRRLVLPVPRVSGGWGAPRGPTCSQLLLLFPSQPFLRPGQTGVVSDTGSCPRTDHSGMGRLRLPPR